MINADFYQKKQVYKKSVTLFSIPKFAKKMFTVEMDPENKTVVEVVVILSGWTGYPAGS